ncbi:fungal-specific transcription factor domain-containing protein, partial [Xylariales sp. PMI_506]
RPRSTSNSRVLDAKVHVTYHCFPFLKADFSIMPEEDNHFLDTQGCFNIPERRALDEFIREYFLHVHPSLPLLDESLFWSMYFHKGPRELCPSSMSLFVFQAMLFASCSFLSPSTVKKLGFASIRCARASYYRRAKLLFDFGGETDPVANARGALLLSYHASMRDQKRTNSLWLSTAIHFARGARAHQCYLDNSLYENRDRQRALKRLWWCCIVRDRILPLGLRRQVHIIWGGGDSVYPALNENDFEDEIACSRVYDPGTKRTLTRIFITLCDLAVSLTDVLGIIYPTSDSIDNCLSDTSTIRKRLGRINRCKSGLNTWFEKATVKFPTPAGILSKNESLILYTNLMYMYYHAARLSLYQHEALIVASHPAGIQLPENGLRRSRMQLEDASAAITENLKELIQLKLGKYLPISVGAYVALPLVLHIMDVNLSEGPSQTAQKQGRLNVYTEAMKGMRLQYEAADEVCQVVRAIVSDICGRAPTPEIGRIDNDALTLTDDANFWPSFSSQDSERVKSSSDWGHLFLQQPILYFRVTQTIELSLSLGRYPAESDFPLLLKSTRIPLYQITMDDFRNGSTSRQAIDSVRHSLQWRDFQDSADRVETRGIRGWPASDPTGNTTSGMYIFTDQEDYGDVDMVIPLLVDDFDLDLPVGEQQSQFSHVPSIEF